MNKSWKQLQFIKQIVVKPEDPTKHMFVQLDEEVEVDEDPWYIGPLRAVSRDRSIKLGANTMYQIEVDYPEDFKKLVAVTGDCAEAYRIYQALQRKVPDNWEDHGQGNVW